MDLQFACKVVYISPIAFMYVSVLWSDPSSDLFWW